LAEGRGRTLPVRRRQLGRQVEVEIAVTRAGLDLGSLPPLVVTGDHHPIGVAADGPAPALPVVFAPRPGADERIRPPGVQVVVPRHHRRHPRPGHPLRGAPLAHAIPPPRQHPGRVGGPGHAVQMQAVEWPQVRRIRPLRDPDRGTIRIHLCADASPRLDRVLALPPKEDHRLAAHPQVARMLGVDGQQIVERIHHIGRGVEEGARHLQVDRGPEAVLGRDVEQPGEIGLGLVVLDLGAVPRLHETVDTRLLGFAHVPLNRGGIGRGIGLRGLVGERLLPDRQIEPGVIERQDEPLTLCVGGDGEEQARSEKQQQQEQQSSMFRHGADSTTSTLFGELARAFAEQALYWPVLRPAVPGSWSALSPTAQPASG